MIDLLMADDATATTARRATARRLSAPAMLCRLLNAHCSADPAIQYASLTLAQGAALGACHIGWPSDAQVPAELAEAAAKALVQGRNTLVRLPSGGAAPVLAMAAPIFVGGRAIGAVAVQAALATADSTDAMLQALRGLAGAVAAQAGEASCDSTAGGSGVASAPGLPGVPAAQGQDALLDADTLAEGALALCTQLATALECARVSVGVVPAWQAAEIAVLAVSHCEHIEKEQLLVRRLSAVLRECADQACLVRYPAQQGDASWVTLAHADFKAHCGHALLSVPLVVRGRAIGALLFERPADLGFEPSFLRQSEQIARQLAPLVALRHANERPWHVRAAEWAGPWFSAGHRRRMAIGAGCLTAAFCAAAAWPVTYHVGAPARIEGAEVRVVAAPFEGFLKKSHVRPGDAVREGQLLIELLDHDLLQEQRKWEAVLAQQENGYAGALGRSERAQFVIGRSKADEARAQLELVQQQLTRSQLVAPLDGVVIEGDLGQSQGAAVQRGQVLLTLAPHGRHRVMVAVDERDIALMQPGQKGKLTLAAYPGQALDLVVERVTPMAQVRDGQNVFDVEARLEASPAFLRPGLQGVARIETVERASAWIWTHRLTDWLRLQLWSWGG